MIGSSGSIGCGDPPLDRALEEQAPAGSTGLRAWPVLRQGDQGPAVRAAQLLLEARGHGAASEGPFTAATARAVQQLQRDAGLAVDGVVGPQTWEALVTWVELGSAGPAVRAAQQLLLAAGYQVPSDGRLDEASERAIAQLQDARCLTATGAVGVLSWSALVAGVSYCEGGPVGALSFAEVAALAAAAGMPCGEPLAQAVAIARAESGLRGNRLNRNPPTAGCAEGSDDVGLWQLNDCYHPEVSRDCALQPACNARAMVTISRTGADWTPWSVFKSQAYATFLPAARVAAEEACR